MTDSVNNDNAEAQNTASQPLFSLADVDTLYELFEVVLYDVLRRSVAVSEGKLSKDEAAAMDKQSAAFVSAVLAGKNEQFAPKPFWTGDPLAGYLRLFMKKRFVKSSQSAHQSALELMWNRSFGAMPLEPRPSTATRQASRVMARQTTASTLLRSRS